jgi:hypothetical protein
MRIFAAASVVASAALLSIACTDATSIAKRAVPPIRASTTAASGAGPVSHPNSVKYRDSGFHPATGRSGSSVVSVRSLLDKSATTSVEITTGTFDGDPVVGTLARAQVKAFGPSGKLAWTDNRDVAGRGANITYTNLTRGMALQVQTLVGSADSSRTDVVTLADAVHLRPDLIASLQGPNQAPVGTAVNLDGFVFEGNYDVGARANCVLYVDGAPVDHADGIWVDAGGVVDCAMTHVFSSTGTYAVELRVETVSPADYDDTNNRSTLSIRILGPHDFSTFSFQAWSIYDTTWYRSVSQLTDWDGTVETWDQTYRRKTMQQYASLNGLIPRSLEYPIRLEGEMRTNGATVNTLDLTYWSAPYVDWMGGFCTSTYAFYGGANTYVCVYTTGDYAGYTQIQYDWWGAAEVRYHSESYVTFWDPSGQLHEQYIVNDWDGNLGPTVTFGPDFFGRIAVWGAGDTEPTTAETTIPIGPTDLYFDYQDPGCLTTPVSVGCFELHGHDIGLMGYVNYGSWPPYTP